VARGVPFFNGSEFFRAEMRALSDSCDSFSMPPSPDQSLNLAFSLPVGTEKVFYVP